MELHQEDGGMQGGAAASLQAAAASSHVPIEYYSCYLNNIYAENDHSATEATMETEGPSCGSPSVQETPVCPLRTTMVLNQSSASVKPHTLMSSEGGHNEGTDGTAWPPQENSSGRCFRPLLQVWEEILQDTVCL